MVMAEEALGHSDVIRMLRGQFDELDRIYRSLRTGEELDTVNARFSNWREETAHLLRLHVGPVQATRLSGYAPPSVLGTKAEILRNRISRFKSFTIVMIDMLEAHPEQVRPSAVKRALGLRPASRTPKIQKKCPPRVFIVHGHDELNALRLENLLRGHYDLAPIVLRDEAGQGRTVIEKFEQEADGARYAIVLMTPDDLVRKLDVEYAQARPNVLFELGWFQGRLGRSRICLLCRNGTSIPSDLDGINRVHFENSVEEAGFQIVRELRVAGLVP